MTDQLVKKKTCEDYIAWDWRSGVVEANASLEVFDNAQNVSMVLIFWVLMQNLFVLIELDDFFVYNMSARRRVQKDNEVTVDQWGHSWMQ